MPAVAIKPMDKMRLRALMASAQKDSQLWGSVLVFFGALFLLLAFPFYPIYIVPLIALAAGIISYKISYIGLLFSMVITLPAVAYQSPHLAWLYLFPIAVTLFEMYENWHIIAFLQVVIFMPFAPFPFSLLSGFIFLVLALGALIEGSKKSIALALPAVLVILLLSTLWLAENGSFMPLSQISQNYGPALAELSHNAREAAPLPDLLMATGGSLVSMLDMGIINDFGSRILPKVQQNLFTLFVSDSAVLQLVSWGVALFLIGYLPARFESKHKQAISSAALVLIPLANVLISFAYPATPFDFFVFLYLALSLGIIYFMETNHLSFSRERSIMRDQKSKEMGLSDLSSSEGAESMSEIGGYEDVKNELSESIVSPLKQKEIAYAYGIKPPNGILLFGPPGTGKTLLMRALSKELKIPFYYVKGSNLLSEWYGQSERNVSDIFKKARKQAPCVLFFDEIDSIGKKRDSYSNDDVAPRILSVFLEELDGFKSQNKVIVIGATNAPQQLDPALTRPGRFDKIIYMHLPDAPARAEIFKVHISGVPHEAEIDFGKLGRITERYSGADIKNICTEATRMAAREAMAQKMVVPLRTEHLLAALKAIRPSTTIDSLEEYEKFRLDFERRSGKVEQKPEESAQAVRWEDVAGLEKVKQSLLEAIEIPLTQKGEALMKKFRIKPSKGLLLFGPPGCGKTMIVKAAANELKSTFLSISGAELMKKGYGNSTSILKETFNRAREQAPALIFIDEIEALAPSRDYSSSAVLTQLLQELDGVKELKNVMLVGATNKPSMLDSALLRPGRFDKIMYIPSPDMPAREQIFEQNLGQEGKVVDIEKLATETEGYSGADIASICQEAKMALVRAEMGGKEARLTTQYVFSLISARRPSITRKDLAEYAAFLEEYGERK
ncbi:AAA family ATPase [Candidatus Micrarchaeota archaeon]|nr:AAA family ATPase [Candidatus Micrarchaeota archaeon]